MPSLHLDEEHFPNSQPQAPLIQHHAVPLGAMAGHRREVISICHKFKSEVVFRQCNKARQVPCHYLLLLETCMCLNLSLSGVIYWEKY